MASPIRDPLSGFEHMLLSPNMHVSSGWRNIGIAQERLSSLIETLEDMSSREAILSIISIFPEVGSTATLMLLYQNGKMVKGYIQYKGVRTPINDQHLALLLRKNPEGVARIYGNKLL